MREDEGKSTKVEKGGGGGGGGRHEDRRSDRELVHTGSCISVRKV
jgi:hypothetical protein